MLGILPIQRYLIMAMALFIIVCEIRVLKLMGRFSFKVFMTMLSSLYWFGIYAHITYCEIFGIEEGLSRIYIRSGIFLVMLTFSVKALATVMTYAKHKR